jgi:hypothetical protein
MSVHACYYSWTFTSCAIGCTHQNVRVVAADGWGALEPVLPACCRFVRGLTCCCCVFGEWREFARLNASIWRDFLFPEVAAFSVLLFLMSFVWVKIYAKPKTESVFMNTTNNRKLERFIECRFYLTEFIDSANWQSSVVIVIFNVPGMKTEIWWVSNACCIESYRILVKTTCF